MNIGIYRSSFCKLTLVRDGFATLDAAEEYARANYRIEYFERDAYTHHAADFLSKDGGVYAIQPTKGA